MAEASKLATERHSEETKASRLFERHFSPAQLAEQWNLSEDTVRRVFELEPDVLIFENPERGSSRRRRTLRIPQSVAERVYRRLCSRGFDRKG
jgi:hypothetical protein